MLFIMAFLFDTIDWYSYSFVMFSFFLSTSLIIYLVPLSFISIHSKISLFFFKMFFLTSSKYWYFFLNVYSLISYSANSFFIRFDHFWSLYTISIENMQFDKKYSNNTYKIKLVMMIIFWLINSFILITPYFFKIVILYVIEYLLNL